MRQLLAQRRKLCRLFRVRIPCQGKCAETSCRVQLCSPYMFKNCALFFARCMSGTTSRLLRVYTLHFATSHTHAHTHTHTSGTHVCLTETCLRSKNCKLHSCNLQLCKASMHAALRAQALPCRNVKPTTASCMC